MAVKMRICIMCVLLTGACAEIFDETSSKKEENDVSDNLVISEATKIPLSDLPVFTLETLRPHNGTNPFLPILLGLKGVVFDVTSGSKFYAPGKAYANFAGRDVTRNTAMFSTKNRDLDRIDYPPEKQSSLDSKILMIALFQHAESHVVRPDIPPRITEIYNVTYLRKYPIVGTLVNSNTEPPPGTESEESAEEESKPRGPVLKQQPRPPPSPTTDWALAAVAGPVCVLLLIRFGIIDIAHFIQ
jgi:predicted heme/steroid binding protein